MLRALGGSSTWNQGFCGRFGACLGGDGDMDGSGTDWGGSGSFRQLQELPLINACKQTSQTAAKRKHVPSPPP